MEQLHADWYTLRAESQLKRVEENRELQQAIKEGDQEKFNEIMEGILKNKRTWGDHIKRYIFDRIGEGNMSRFFDWVSEDGMNIDDITQENMMEFIKKAFADNGMKNQGSMKPAATTKLGSNLKRWLDSPVTKISRETCFLFCFGLNMDEESASYMLEVLRQPDFNPRDYQEAIYYYCLRNNKQYAGVLEWLQVYEKLECKEGLYNPNTMVLRNKLEAVAEMATEQEFREYLRMLKSIPANNRRSETRAKVFRRDYWDVFYILSQEKIDSVERDFKYLRDSISKGKSFAQVNNTLYLDEEYKFDEFEKCLLSVPVEPVKAPEALKEMVKEEVIIFPSFTAGSLEHMAGGERGTEISREDILMMIFLHCTSSMGEDFAEEGEYDYAKRKADFQYEANLRLEKCGFGYLYLLNPFELLLVSCLLQPKPMEYFLALWKQFRKEK